MSFLTRRNFLKSALFGSIALPTIAAANNKIVTEDLEITKTDIISNKLPVSFNGYKICFISDIHCGILLDQDYLEKSLASAAAENPDLLILGGDYIGIPDSTPGRGLAALRGLRNSTNRNVEVVASIHSRLGNALQKIKAKDGTLAILGNHDHWNNAELCVSTLSKFDIKFLINDGTAIQRGNDKIQIFGVDDFWTGIPELSDNFLLENKNDFKILLSHNPDFVSETLKTFDSTFDLALAGHTHGGQVVIKGIGALAGYRIRDQRFRHGKVNLGNSIVYTSRGMGVVDLPLRVNARPEIAFFRLLSA